MYQIQQSNYFDYYWEQQSIKKLLHCRESSNIWHDQTTCTFIINIINILFKQSFLMLTLASFNQKKSQTSNIPRPQFVIQDMSISPKYSLNNS